MNNQILDAILRANKLGAKGIRVINYIEPSSASQPPDLILVVSPKEEPQTASETAWWED